MTMEMKPYCASFVPILLLSLHSSLGQMIYQKDDKDYAVELKSCTSRLRQNEIAREKLTDTVLSLQNDVVLLKTGTNQQETSYRVNLTNKVISLQNDVALLKTGLHKQVSPGNMNLKDEVGAIKREVESVKMQIESFKCFIPGLHEPNTADFIGGRTGGNPFNDCSSWKGRDITAVRLGCSTVFLFYIQLKYGDTWAPQHGLQDGCDPESLYGVRSIQNVTYDLDPSEYVTSISGTSHPTRTYVQSITFRTNKRTLPRCGPEDGVKKTVNGSHLLYISGRKGCVIDGIELHWLQ